ncbi:MAG: hypothetical protein KC636_25085 [Myxococcales bacterium]|nr:hypothetical protein [Myxococcales bacterium]
MANNREPPDEPTKEGPGASDEERPEESAEQGAEQGAADDKAWLERHLPATGALEVVKTSTGAVNEEIKRIVSSRRGKVFFVVFGLIGVLVAPLFVTLLGLAPMSMVMVAFAFLIIFGVFGGILGVATDPERRFETMERLDPAIYGHCEALVRLGVDRSMLKDIYVSVTGALQETPLSKLKELEREIRQIVASGENLARAQCSADELEWRLVDRLSKAYGAIGMEPPESLRIRALRLRAGRAAESKALGASDSSR